MANSCLLCFSGSVGFDWWPGLIGFRFNCARVELPTTFTMVGVGGGGNMTPNTSIIIVGKTLKKRSIVPNKYLRKYTSHFFHPGQCWGQRSSKVEKIAIFHVSFLKCGLFAGKIAIFSKFDLWWPLVTSILTWPENDLSKSLISYRRLSYAVYRLSLSSVVSWRQ